MTPRPRPDRHGSRLHIADAVAHCEAITFRVHAGVVVSGAVLHVLVRVRAADGRLGGGVRAVSHLPPGAQARGGEAGGGREPFAQTTRW